MGRLAKEKDVPHLPPVEKIELNEKKSKTRLILTIAFAVIGVLAITYGVYSFLTVDPGWREIEADSASDYNCADDFVFQYNIGSSGISATAEYRALRSLYSALTKDAYRIYSESDDWADVHNLKYLSAHPNEEIEVDATLYSQLKYMMGVGIRNVFLAPIYEQYYNLLFCNYDSEAALFDPDTNSDMARFFESVCAFINDEYTIGFEFFEGNVLKLVISDEYLSFAKENNIERFLDFGWMKNACIIDYLADNLTKNGYTLGVISSYDGMTRILGGEGEYTVSFFDRVENDVFRAASLSYGGNSSSVYLRDFPLSNEEKYISYVTEQGKIISRYINIADGRSHTEMPSLLLKSADYNCTKLACIMTETFISSDDAYGMLDDLKIDGIYCVYCKDKKVFCSDKDMTVAIENEEYGIA
ncbi:MAG: hypothetical protein J5922_04605 [Clostridia bacterium]|nr:hypothetical protein [Clostridia bacterium]